MKKKVLALFLTAILILSGCTNRLENADNTAVGNENNDTENIGISEEIEKSNLTCTIEIDCKTVLNNKDLLEEGKEDIVPEDGIILNKTVVAIKDGDSVFDVLQRICRENKIHMESVNTPVYDSVYIEGIGNLYEFDCGSLSGWMYSVNGEFPNYGCSNYPVQDGDIIEWRYSCDLGEDVGKTPVTE